MHPLCRRALSFALFVGVARAEEEPVIFRGMCDASAASAIDATRFIAADDEDNLLRIYERSGGPPLAQTDLSAFLGAIGRKGARETDIEGAAQVGERTYWITSHGRNAKAQTSPERHRLFATVVHTDARGPRLEAVGRPYVRLLEDLLGDRRLRQYRLAEAALLAPKAPGGFNIEGLAATPEGLLLIGLRSPVPGGRALVIPLLNPREVTEGGRARLGAPRELDLGGFGIRSFGFSGGRYLIIAGPPDEGRGARLYEWNGGADVPRPVPGVSFRGLRPEGIAFPAADDAAREEFFVLSDDGRREIGGVACKDFPDAADKRFQGRVVRW